MQETYVYPITGLYDECHHVDFVALERAQVPQPNDPYSFRQLNDLWWQRLLQADVVADTVDRLRAWMQPGVDAPIAWSAIAASPSTFVTEVVEAPRRLVDLGAGPRSAFRAIEALSLYANIHSNVVSRPYELSLQEGYVVNELSSLELTRAGLNPSLNPYLTFLEQNAFPALEASRPDILWLVGRIRLSTFAMAQYAKQINPNCHVSVVGHSSEYYSLNKIAKYLKTNALLFSVVDSIVLDDFDRTPGFLRDALSRGDSLESVPNLMYVSGGEIHQTGYVTADRELDSDLRVPPLRPEYADLVAPSSVVAETRLWPAAQCYWNNCNFCAINRRYNTLPKNSFAQESERADLMRRLASNGTRFLWSVDEAIPPVNLGILAEELIERGSPLVWETRSKIDKNFSEDICSRLGKSGLREIRLGLESANPRVLSSMGKYGGEWSLATVEEIVARFHEAGVSVHFPTIIGYPGETTDERNDTYQFLEYLTQKYPSVTFNINLLGFDVASNLFEEYESFGVTTLRWPAPAKYFLGNLIDWDCEETPFNYDVLNAERNAFMRRVLYPWMPESPSVEPYIFYRLTETSRATMVWKSQRYEQGSWSEPRLSVQFDEPLQSPEDLVVMGPFNRGRFDEGEHYLCYAWSTHQSFECDEFAAEILRSLVVPQTAVELAALLGTDAEEVEQVIRALAAVGAISNSGQSRVRPGARFAPAPPRWQPLAVPAKPKISRPGKPSISLNLEAHRDQDLANALS